MTFETSECEHGLPVLDWLHQRIPAAPVPYLRQLLRSGKVFLNGKSAGATDLMERGDLVRLPDSRRLQELLHASACLPEILMETADFLVVMKPSGLAVHPGMGHEQDNLLSRVQAAMERRLEPFKVAPVHRLDLETSGPVLFGKGRKACALLGEKFMAGEVEKLYYALAAGIMETSGKIEIPVAAKGKLKDAATSYRVLQRLDRYAFLELRLHSGRTHQVRRHFAAQGSPLAGDRRYGGPDVPGLERLFLHCCRLAFSFRDVPVVIDTPLPADLTAVLRALKAADDE
jgi:RluA family pseudouridine synthase